VIRVLIADDHAIYREGLKKILEAAGLAVAAEAANGEEALQLAKHTHPDVAIVDLTMPGRGGIETVQELKRREPRIRVLVLTMHSEDNFAVRCLREGADGYLTKDAAPDQVLTAVRKIYSGGKYVSSLLAERLAANLDINLLRAPHEKLSHREFQVISLIGAGKTAGEIAGELHLSVKTVSTYRARILEKMDMKSTVEIIRYVVLHGLTE
jgi:two-component system, NarL family, invasion response regulator UvrY